MKNTVAKSTPGRNLWQRIARDEAGSIATVFALTFVPIIAAAGVAVDFSRVVMAQTALQSLADRTAVAAAAFDGSESQQEAEGVKFISNNDADLAGVEYTSTVDVTGQDVVVTINADIAGTLLPAAFGGQSENDGGHSAGDAAIIIGSTARYVDSVPGLVCLLTTNPSAADAIFFSGTRTFEAIGCGVHSDSNDATSAIHLQGNRNAIGDFFNAVGGWSHAGGAGYFSETPVSGKSTFGDPFDLVINCPSTTGPNATPANGAVLSASSYNNINIQNNRTVTFSAGVHYIHGTIDINNGGTLIGNGVTLVLCGSNANIDMNGGVLRLQAPTTGTYPGFAVVGSQNATAVSELQGGPSTYVRGIWYTPKAKLEISGNADFNVDSSYFPVIADTFYLNGSGSMTIKMDYSAYGYDEPTALLQPEERTVWLVD
jgi:Putative Flp pilus-assembly TadE/G-like